MPLSWQPLAKCRALLIGFSDYPSETRGRNQPSDTKEEDCISLPAVKNNITQLKKLLINPEIIGLDQENVIVWLDKGTNAKLQSSVYAIGQETTGTFFVYFAGHGLIGRTKPDLFLATSETEFDKPDFSGLPVDAIQKAFHESPANTKIFILDCCFSGRGLKGVMGGSETAVLRASMDIKGTCAIASAPANKLAVAPPDAEYTAFTGELVRALTDGIENAQETLTLDDVFKTIRNELRSRPDLPIPERITDIDDQQFVFALNRKFRLTIDERMAQLKELVERKFGEYDKYIVAPVEGRLGSSRFSDVLTSGLWPAVYTVIPFLGAGAVTAVISSRTAIVLMTFFQMIYFLSFLTAFMVEFVVKDSRGRSLVQEFIRPNLLLGLSLLGFLLTTLAGIFRFEYFLVFPAIWGWDSVSLEHP